VLFALGAQDAVNRVGRAVRGFMIMADLHFAEQADGQHVQSGEQKDCGENHHGAVLVHDGVMVDEFFE